MPAAFPVELHTHMVVNGYDVGGGNIFPDPRETTTEESTTAPTTSKKT